MEAARGGVVGTFALRACSTVRPQQRYPISLVHLSNLRYGIEWNRPRGDPRFQKL